MQQAALINCLSLHDPAATVSQVACGAPKKPVAKGEVAVHLKTERVKLDVLSIAEDSGWREINGSGVQELVLAFEQDDCGNTTFTAGGLSPEAVLGQGGRFIPTASHRRHQGEVQH